MEEPSQHQVAWGHWKGVDEKSSRLLSDRAAAHLDHSEEVLQRIAEMVVGAPEEGVVAAWGDYHPSWKVKFQHELSHDRSGLSLMARR